MTEINAGLIESIYNSTSRFALHFLWLLLLLILLLLLLLLLLLVFNFVTAGLPCFRLCLCGQLEARRKHDQGFEAGSYHFWCVLR